MRVRVTKLDELFGINGDDYMEMEDESFVSSPVSSRPPNAPPSCVILTPEEKERHARNTSLGKMGHRHSQETKDKIRETVSSLPLPEAFVRQQQADVTGENNPFFGKTHSDDTKQKMREAKIRQNYETRKRMKEILMVPDLTDKERCVMFGVNIHTLRGWRRKLKGEINNPKPQQQ